MKRWPSSHMLTCLYSVRTTRALARRLFKNALNAFCQDAGPRRCGLSRSRVVQLAKRTGPTTSGSLAEAPGVTAAASSQSSIASPPTPSCMESLPDSKSSTNNIAWNSIPARPSKCWQRPVQKPKSGKAYASVWAVNDPKTRIANIALGHANEAHGNPAYQAILVNAVRWVAAKSSEASSSHT